jgi:putative membrane protein
MAVSRGVVVRIVRAWTPIRVHYVGGFFGRPLGILLTLALLALFVVLIVMAVSTLVHRDARHTAPPHARATDAGPERILRERLARGEIDEDEYRRRVAVLRESP